MHLMDSARLRAFSDHLAVELFEMFRVKLPEPMRADARDEMHSTRDLVRAVCVVSENRRGDYVLQPVGKPRIDCPVLPDLADLAVITSPFQVSDLADNRVFRLRHHVPPVRLAVVLDTDGHTSVPVTVVAEVDG
jgi:hypothetical protein